MFCPEFHFDSWKEEERSVCVSLCVWKRKRERLSDRNGHLTGGDGARSQRQAEREWERKRQMETGPSRLSVSPCGDKQAVWDLSRPERTEMEIRHWQRRRERGTMRFTHLCCNSRLAEARNKQEMMQMKEGLSMVWKRLWKTSEWSI